MERRHLVQVSILPHHLLQVVLIIDPAIDLYLILDPDPDKRPYPPHQYRHQCQDPCNWDDFNDLILHLYSSSFRYFTFRIHLGITHQIKDSEEKKAFIEVNEFLTDIYTCKVGG